MSVEDVRQRIFVVTKGMAKDLKKQWVSDFVARWSPGYLRMDPKQFSRALESIGVPKSTASSSDLFKQIDADGNGFVDINELWAVVKGIQLAAGAERHLYANNHLLEGEGVSQKWVKPDGAKSVAKEREQEYKAFIHKIGTKVHERGLKNVARLQIAMDPDDNGSLDRREMGMFFRTFLNLSQEHANRFFDLLDVDKDQSLSTQDLCSRLAPYIQRGFVDPSQEIQEWFEKPSKPSRSASSAASTRESGMSPQAATLRRSGSIPSGSRSSRAPSEISRGSGYPVAASSRISNTSRYSTSAPVKVDLSDILLNEFKKLILKRGGAHGIHTLGRTFSVMDTNRNNTISPAELETGLMRFGLHMNRSDVEMLMKALDKKNGGKFVTFDEFMVAVRGEISERRLRLIKQAFDTMDHARVGKLEAGDIKRLFSPKHHPEVMAGNMQPDRALDDFLSQFDTIDHDGVVTRKEFVEYYRNVSASVDRDDYFELMIRNAWHLSGGTGASENTSNKRILVTFIDGSQKVVALENDMGLDLRDHKAVLRHLEKQGVRSVRTFRLSG